MKRILITILKLLLGIFAFGLTLFILQYLLGDIIKVHKLNTLKWFSILVFFIGFYLSGLITKNLSLKYIPILAIQFSLFFLKDGFYFTFKLILILFSIFGLFLARKEFKKSYKYFSIIPFLTLFVFYLFSQPLIIEKEYFGTNMQGDYINAKLIWDFSNNEKLLPELSFYNEQNKEIDISKFSDKKIVITFWATWCVPCLEEKPELEKIKTEFENNENIVFIDVSFDKHSESWKKYLKYKTPKGIQLISNDIDADKASLNISGIPHRIVVNQKGNYRECRILPTLKQILKQNDTIFNAFINQKKQFIEYVLTEKKLAIPRFLVEL